MKKNNFFFKIISFIIGIIFISNFSIAQKPNSKELPSISFSASKNIVVLDDDKDNVNIVKLDSKFNSLGTKELPSS